MVNAVVFVGSSLDQSNAKGILPAQMAPPIKRGDIDTIMAADLVPDYIGIVDGQFFQNLSISPKEVLRAMDRGVRMFGASSIGALRAVELSPYGMVGIGQIYELFQSGQIDADDEVAITYEADSFRPLCEPMVNIRIAIDAAVATDVISRAAADRFIQAAKALYFPDRSYAAILRITAGEMDSAEHARLKVFLKKSAPDAKRDDAIEMLQRMRMAIEGKEDDR